MAKVPKRTQSPFRFDRAAASRAVDFFDQCVVHVKGELAGQPFRLEEWQTKKLVRPLFGWKRRDDGNRKYRTAFVEVPRKNGKSSIASGLALYLLTADNEPGAEIYAAAADKEQARLVFNPAKEMIRQSPELSKLLADGHIEIFKDAIYYAPTSSVFQCITKAADTKHGFNAHGLIVDELHAHKNRELWDVLTTSTGARRQPMTIVITTAGHDRESVCYEQYKYAKAVAAGSVDDPTFLPLIFEADNPEKWDDPRQWAKANPNLGVSLKLEYLESMAAKAKETPRLVNTFRRLHLNIWTEAETRWLNMRRWDKAAKAPSMTLADLEGRPCWAGLDLSSTQDTTSLALCWRVDDEDADGNKPPRRYVFRVWSWLPREGIEEKEKRDAAPWFSWSTDEDKERARLELTEGEVIDYDVLRARINEIGERFGIQEIGVDPWNGTQLMTQLVRDGFEVVQVRQGFRSMNEPSKEFEKVVTSTRIDTGADPILRYMAANATVESDPAGNIKPKKAKDRRRIDGIVACVVALSRAMVAPDKEEQSVYAERGVLSI